MGMCNKEQWLEDIGEVIQSTKDGEFFWMLPDVFIYSYECCVTSPSFSFDQETWCLVMMPSDGSQAATSGIKFSSLFLWPKGSSELKQTYKVRLGIKTPDGEEICCHRGETFQNYGFGNWEFLSLEGNLPDCFIHGRVKIFCVIERKEEIPANLTSNSPMKKKMKMSTAGPVSGKVNDKNNTVNEINESDLKGVDRLIQNYRNLLHNEQGSDIILDTEDHEFPAHKTVLGARSPVFASMFQHDMAEKKTGKVDVSDCPTAAFRVFMEFLYTGKTADISADNVSDLFYVADK